MQATDSSTTVISPSPVFSYRLDTPMQIEISTVLRPDGAIFTHHDVLSATWQVETTPDPQNSYGHAPSTQLVPSDAGIPSTFSYRLDTPTQIEISTALRPDGAILTHHDMLSETTPDPQNSYGRIPSSQLLPSEAVISSIGNTRGPQASATSAPKYPSVPSSLHPDSEAVPLTLSISHHSTSPGPASVVLTQFEASHQHTSSSRSEGFDPSKPTLSPSTPRNQSKFSITTFRRITEQFKLVATPDQQESSQLPTDTAIRSSLSHMMATSSAETTSMESSSRITQDSPSNPSRSSQQSLSRDMITSLVTSSHLSSSTETGSRPPNTSEHPKYTDFPGSESKSGPSSLAERGKSAGVVAGALLGTSAVAVLVVIVARKARQQRAHSVPCPPDPSISRFSDWS
ncbi:hypothetical protein AJ80_09491 [Polytolypa hystricis UAMH7299]|uniref:Uncharacterized protein n=1 Tax=Polytolypa hystricis (strain UAMH7299) TaxID=1447883 RepID=A0A2B7WPT5_POLH7|nr:hypothetical protein AJ80_09491 [Polytolypa hystricis UAMH7299]